MTDFSFIVNFLWRLAMTLAGLYLLRECTGLWTAVVGVVAIYLAEGVTFRVRVGRSP